MMSPKEAVLICRNLLSPAISSVFKELNGAFTENNLPEASIRNQHSLSLSHRNFELYHAVSRSTEYESFYSEKYGIFDLTVPLHTKEAPKNLFSSKELTPVRCRDAV